MSESLASAYDAQSISDVFLRYTSNRTLLDILASILGLNRTARHIDVGFSGRLALFGCLTDNLAVLNLSRTQTELGLQLLKIAVQYYASCHQNSGQTSTDFEAVFPEGLWNSISPILDEQITVIENAGKWAQVPPCIHTYHTLFDYETADLAESSFETLSMIDVVVHIADVAPIFAEISRILVADGHAVITYFTPESDASDDNAADSVDQLFSRLCAEYSVPFDEVYDRVTYTVYPSNFNKYLVSSGRPPVEGKVAKQYWLDLPFFKLHKEQDILAQMRQSSLDLKRLETVPGGMFPAYRRAIVLHKPS